MKAVPVMSLIWQHVLCRQSVSILLHPSLVPLGTNLLMKFDKIILHGEVQKSLSSLLIQFVVPVHIAGETRQGRDLFLSTHSLNAIPNNLSFVRVADSPNLLEEAHASSEISHHNVHGDHFSKPLMPLKFTILIQILPQNCEHFSYSIYHPRI